MSAPPPVPPVPDQDRYQSIAVTQQIAYADVVFPIYGDVTDLALKVDGAVLPPSTYALVSKSGQTLGNIAQPITDGRILFFPPIASGTLEIIGAIHARQTTMPSAPGIGRREFNQTVGLILSALRELERAATITDATAGLVPNAVGPLASRSNFDAAPANFVFLQTDFAGAAPVFYVKNSAAAGDWSGAMTAQGPQGIQGNPGSISSNPYLVSLDANTLLANLMGSAQPPTEYSLSAFAAALNSVIGFPLSATGSLGLFPACTAAPANYVTAAGQLVSRTGAAANLWAWAQANATVVADGSWSATPGVYSSGDGSTTFRLPRIDGDFLRMLDLGSGHDAGRAIGTYQADAIQNHTHSGVPGPAAIIYSAGGTPASVESGSTNTGGMASGSVAAETRGRNSVVLGCIHL